MSNADDLCHGWPDEALSRHDLNHQLVISRTNSRFLEVPTIQLIGFPFRKEGVLNAGYIFLFWAVAPLGRGGLVLARSARLT